MKILDFGIAKLTGTLGQQSPGTSGTMGTPAYMAPEQWGNAANADYRADMYSLGCVLFEMACGRPPFAGATYADFCAKHLTAPPPLVSSFAYELGPVLNPLVARLLAKDPAQRGADMKEVERALEGASRAVPHHHAMPALRALRWCRGPMPARRRRRTRATSWRSRRAAPPIRGRCSAISATRRARSS